MTDILVPISTGELMDKITILEIKSERIANPAQHANIMRELTALRSVADQLDGGPLQEPGGSLKTINSELWRIEDDIRACEARGDFGAEFIALARAVYRLNDERARLKRTINEISGSRFVEEKSYRDFQRDGGN
jgi:hypothetical protein